MLPKIHHWWSGSNSQLKAPAGFNMNLRGPKRSKASPTKAEDFSKKSHKNKTKRMMNQTTFWSLTIPTNAANHQGICLIC